VLVFTFEKYYDCLGTCLSSRAETSFLLVFTPRITVGVGDMSAPCSCRGGPEMSQFVTVTLVVDISTLFHSSQYTVTGMGY